MERMELNEVLKGLAPKGAQAGREDVGSPLVSADLCGSAAQGHARNRSDMDLLLVCLDLPEGMSKRHALLQPVPDQLQNDLGKL
jgi:predicted nucleotidyltransferase